MSKPIPIDAALQDKFEDLLCRLSPENLHEDGEAAASHVELKHRRIRTEWAELERKAGRTVCQAEVRRWATRTR